MTGEIRNDAIARDLEDADPVRRLGAITHLIHEPATPLSDRAVAALARCLGAESKAVQRRAADAIAAVSRRDRRVIAAAREALASAGSRGRWGAAYALGAIGAEAFAMDSADSLLEALASADGDVRWAAAELVVRLGREHPRQIRTRLAQLAARGDPVARRMALYCLRDLGAAGEGVIALAESASRAEDAHLRLASLSLLRHLGDCGDEAAAIALRCLESDPSAGVRCSAAIALGHIGNRAPRIVAALSRAAARRADQSLARAAHAALERLGEKR